MTYFVMECEGKEKIDFASLSDVSYYIPYVRLPQTSLPRVLRTFYRVIQLDVVFRLSFRFHLMKLVSNNEDADTFSSLFIALTQLIVFPKANSRRQHLKSLSTIRLSVHSNSSSIYKQFCSSDKKKSKLMEFTFSLLLR